MFGFREKTKMIDPERALPGRDERDAGRRRHIVLGTPLEPPFPDGLEQAVVGWAASGAPSASSGRLPGVYTTAVGYAGGFTPNPTYEEVCSGRTGHTEAVLVVFDPAQTSYDEMLRLFWEGHDPTQGMRQGNDVGTQYRSAIYYDERRAAADRGGVSRDAYADSCSARAATARSRPRSPPAGPFYYAEDYHQQYLAKNPDGYCGLGGTGVSCPIGVGRRGVSDVGRRRDATDR